MKLTLTICTILCAAILMSFVSMPGADAAIASYNWTGTITRNSYDAFYGTFITAYEEGTSANLVVNVYNDFFRDFQVNVSAVIVGFDWGTNYTSAQPTITNPTAIPARQSQIFMINLTVPSVLLASNLVVHSYTIYVEHVNSTTGDKGIVDTWQQSGNGFAVFSTDQADAYSLKKQVDAYASSSSSAIPLLTAEARELMLKSSVAKSIASDAYNQGDFSNAKSFYNDSLNFIQQAFSNETQRWSTFENALVSLIQGGGNMLTFQGYAWLFFGIGFLLMGIGVLVYLVRKGPQPKTTAATTPHP